MNCKKPKGANCFICSEIWRKGQNVIKCSKCKKQVHGPAKSKSCSLLKTDEYEILNNSKSMLTKWICPSCTSKEASCNAINNDGLYCLHNTDSISTLNVLPDGNNDTFINEYNNISLNQSENEGDEEEDESLNNINSKYYNIQHFNADIKYDQNSAFALCHTNIASISKHIDELCLSLSILKTKFHIIGITEHKIKTDTDPIVN